jgi:uncharacterized RDD family membrane protein YckC
MSQDYESTVRDSFRRMSTEELIDRNQSGSLTAVGLTLLAEELKARNVSEDNYVQILNEERKEDAVLVGSVAKLMTRFIARGVDGVVAGFIVVLGVMLIDVGGWLLILGSMAYTLFADALPGGKSLGKRLANIQVVDVINKRPCSCGQSFKRNLLLTFPLVGTLDALSIFFDDHNQRWGDKWANTIVVRG